jgi:hypothetical protein
MRTTAWLLGSGVVCLVAAWPLLEFVGSAAGGVLMGLGLLLLVAAIANSYMNDFREGYRSASER